MTTTLPLSGVTVLSFEHAVAAPFATRQLADLGARVIKVERVTGDFARGYDRSVHGQSSYFVWLNRSKESLALDTKSSLGREVIERLLPHVDVVVQNLGPGAAQRMGLGADALLVRYPRLIVCDITGYGMDGPWSDKKAYDLLVQSEAGMLSLTGTPRDMARAGISIADIAAGMYAFSGILTALYQRATTGRGTHVEVSLFEALAEWMAQPALYTHYGGVQPERTGTQHPTIGPYGKYQTADGDDIVIAVQTPSEWQAFCTDVIGTPDLADDPRFASITDRVANRTALDNIIRCRLEKLSTRDLLNLLDRTALAYARVNSMNDFVAHPVLRERARWREVRTAAGPIDALVPPTTLSGVEPRMDPVPSLGEHTDAILNEVGLL